VAVTFFKSIPSGFFQVRTGVGTPSASHVSLTVRPIQDSVAEDVALVTEALSVDYNNCTHIKQSDDANVKELKVT